MESAQLLRSSIERFVPLTDEEFDLILQYATERRYKRGQFIVHEQAVALRTHFITQGAALGYFLDPQGNEHVIQFAIEGWWISDIKSFTTGEPALFNVKAIEDAQLYEFKSEDLQHLYDKIPAFQKYFLIITQRAFSTFQQRMVNNLAHTAEERYHRFIKQYPKLELRFSQKTIASYLGMSPEFLSKIRKKNLQ